MATPAQRLESDRFKYPAMNVDEVLLWRVWLGSHQGEFDRFDYNVRIGQHVRVPEGTPENIAKMARDLTMLRLDAVGWQGDQPTLFEVKRFLTPANLGQLLVYEAAWPETFPHTREPLLRMVCSDFTANILPLVRKAKVIVDVVAVDVAILRPTR